MTAQSSEYFDKQFAELHEFLSQQFGKVYERFEKVDEQMSKLATKEEMYAGFSELHLKLDFVRKEIESVKAELAALTQRTKEDDNAFAKDLVRLTERVKQLEFQVQKLTPQQI